MNNPNIHLISSIYRIVDIKYRYKYVILANLIILGYLAVFMKWLSDYFITDTIIWAALISIIYIVHPDGKSKNVYKYGIGTICFLIMSLISGIQTFYFFSVGMGILFTLEIFWGNTGYLPFFLLGIISPTFKYFNNLFGFPVRLKLSQWAGDILQLLNYKVKVTGNVIILNGTEFSVDPACVGLKMMALSILSGLIIMSYFQRHSHKQFRFTDISIILSLIIALNILSNLIRIILLTAFQILPENPLHDGIGIVCLLVYIIIPTYAFTKWYINKFCNDISDKSRNIEISKTKVLLSVLLLILSVITGILINKGNKPDTSKVSVFHINGYSSEWVQGDIQKLEKQNVLIYIKPINRFYGAEHNPMICWKGSGYVFSHINSERIQGVEIYTGTLKKNNDIIYAAWWFDNGKYRTIAQTDWRWKTLKGDKFYLVNINSGNPKMLYTEIKRFLTNGRQF